MELNQVGFYLAQKYGLATSYDSPPVISTLNPADNTTWSFATNTPYGTWSGGAAFDADANSDGVDNGMAWLLIKEL